MLELGGEASLVAQRSKSVCLQCGRPGFDPWVWKIPWRGKWQPTSVFLLENHMDGGAWWATVHGVAKSRTRLSDFTFTFHFHFHFSLSCTGEGNGNPL